MSIKAGVKGLELVIGKTYKVNDSTGIFYRGEYGFGWFECTTTGLCFEVRLHDAIIEGV